jgi:hypothetical protein
MAMEGNRKVIDPAQVAACNAKLAVSSVSRANTSKLNKL